MSTWNASHYLTYGSERTRAAEDLVARINLDAPETIADLGCGPGNSTRILRTRWPHARVLGIDDSPQMVETAKRSFPDGDWLLADVSEWAPVRTIDLVYSNAALQWLPNHELLIPRLFAMVASGGALAFQIPSSTFPVVRRLIHEISFDAAWSERLDSPRSALTMETPSFYYDALVEDAAGLDIWETEYSHVMDSTDSIVDWTASTGLRPFLEALDDDDERDSFLAQLRERVSRAYEVRVDGKVLFPFRRTFVIAYR